MGMSSTEADRQRAATWVGREEQNIERLLELAEKLGQRQAKAAAQLRAEASYRAQEVLAVRDRYKLI